MSVPVVEPLLDLQHVSVMRGDTCALEDVSLRIDAGECLAVLGPNGCGKSTLLKVMTCELYPLAREGTQVRVLGRERWDVTELRRRMGVVASDPLPRAALETAGFDAVLTGFFSSVMLWPHLVVTPAMRERADAVATEMKLDALRLRPLGAMSAGQVKRVMIARALAGASAGGHVRMLLLDEPSNALDLAAQAELRELLQGVAERGTAVVLITHHVEDIVPAMRRVVLMQAGRIVADGGVEECLTSHRLSALFGKRIHVDRQSSAWTAR